MAVHFSLTPEDYREYERVYLATFAGFRERHHFKIFISFGALAAIAGLNWIFSLHRNKYYGLLCVVAGIFLVGLGSWSRFWRARRWFSKNRQLYQNIEVRFSGEGLQWRSATAESNTRWAHWRGSAESENLIVVEAPEGSHVILPKRAFAASELDSLRELLRKNLKAA